MMRKSSLQLLLTALLLVLGGVLLTFPIVTDVQAQINTATATPLPLYALPDARVNRSFASGSMALLSDGRTMVAANMINNTATIVIPSQNRIIAEIPVGNDPRGVAITLDDTRALVTNRVSGTLSVISVGDARVVNTIELGGTFPYGVVIGDNRTAYVSLMGSSEIVEVDVVSGVVMNRIAVPFAPAGLALWGEFLYVSHFWSGDLSLLYLPQNRVIETAQTGSDAGLFQAVELDITRGIAYLPQTRSNAQNLSLTYDTTVFPIVNVVDLRGNTIRRASRIALDTADRPVNMPFALALDRFNQRLYVANAGSDDVSVIDLNTGQARAHFDVGSNPRGILLNRDNSLLYIHNTLDATITTVVTETLQIQSVLPISNLTIEVDILLGAQLFYGSSDRRMSADSWVSCANCHFDGLSDGLVWQGFTDGARNTPLLYALPETVPYNWSGTWLELTNIEYKIRELHAGLGLIETGNALPSAEELHDPLIETDLDLLVSYLAQLPAPTLQPSGDAEIRARGAEVFAEQGCATCHVGSVGTDLQAYDVGTGGTFDTPSMRWLGLSAPYFHDGSAAMLYDVFALEGTHQLIYDVSPQDIDALINYLLSLPQ